MVVLRLLLLLLLIIIIIPLMITAATRITTIIKCLSLNVMIAIVQ